MTSTHSSINHKKQLTAIWHAVVVQVSLERNVKSRGIFAMFFRVLRSLYDCKVSMIIMDNLGSIILCSYQVGAIMGLFSF